MGLKSMLVLYTKLFLREEVTENEIDDLVLKWIIGSPHYHFDDLKEQLRRREKEEQAIVSREGLQKFYSLRYEEQDTIVHVYKFDNIEEKVLWTTECTFVQLKQGKYIAISLNCDLKEYNPRLPNKHKPYIIRLLVESGYCLSDGKFPIFAKPIIITQDNVSDVIDIMRGNSSHVMPLIYVSKGEKGCAINYSQLATWLSGIAHVAVEQDRKWTYILREKTKGRNAYGGYVGIYYPQNKSYELFDREEHFSEIDMMREISYSVQQALVNYQNLQEYNWNRVVFLKMKTKMELESKAEVDEFINSFQPINDELNEKVRSLNAQLEIYRDMATNSKGSGSLLKEGQLCEYYAGEKNDLLLTILQCTKEKMDINTRGYELLQSILDENEYYNYGKQIFEELKKILYRGKLNKSSKMELKKLGFDIIEDKGHPKLVFHHNPRYKFPVAGTPGSGRSGKNVYSDISEVIDIYKKPF